MAEEIIQIAQNILKRVVCLYRVSTVGQVEKDDIPMQKQFCREFVQRQTGWEIIKEFSEKGVSGFKKSAKDRDAIQEIQKLALQGGFDILLVFMFDRLGRKDDETPFVVEWFVKNGIEVWSAMEGQQRFDNHVDKMAPPQELIKERQSREVDIAKAKLNLLNGQYQQKQKDYDFLKKLQELERGR